MTALYAGQVKQCTVWVLDSDSYIKVKRFDQNTTQHDAEAALQAAGVEYTVKQVYNSPAAAGCPSRISTSPATAIRTIIISPAHARLS